MMMPVRAALLLVLTLAVASTLHAQTDLTDYDAADETNVFGGRNRRDSLTAGKKVIPKGVRVWTVDGRFGDITRQSLDTLTHLFQNTVYTAGVRGDYNTLGTLGAPRINRIATDRTQSNDQFFFTAPYDFFLHQPSDFLFTNTLSPYANLSYLFCGNRTNGEDNFRAKYAVNAGKRFGAGFDIKYLYSRGYYSDQSTSLLDINLYASYIGEQYQAHLLVTTERIKIAENGGITDDYYITHPETFDDSYATSEIPTMLTANWNRNKGTHLFLTHRYSLGFRHSVPMTEEEIAARQFALESQKENKDAERRREQRARNAQEEWDDDDDVEYTGRPDNAQIMGDDDPAAHTTLTTESLQLDIATADSLAATTTTDDEWMKTVFVPVTSFIHTFNYDTNERIYLAYRSPTDYYANTFLDTLALRSDSIYDKTRYYRVRNTLALSLLEGFNKWIFAGLKAYVTSDLRHYEMPNKYNQLVSDNTHSLNIGAQMTRQQGSLFHYNVLAETCLVGDELGQVKIDGSLDFNFPLLGDTMSLVAHAAFHNEKPNYYLRHYHAQHYWWDNDLSKSTHTRLEGILHYAKTHTTLRFAFDEMTNYTYLCGTYTTTSNGRINNAVTVQQCPDAITLLTASIYQHFILGPLNWETELTWQKSTKQDILPVPTLNIYSNLYLRFRIAKVLLTEIGADVRFFTKYAAPDYSPGVGQYVVQGNDEKTKVGNYPMVNAYLNFNLKGTRFFVMYTHLTYGAGNNDYFLTPHYPLNRRVLRFGLSWNFFN